MTDTSVMDTAMAGLGGIWLILALAIPLIFGAATAQVAQARGYSGFMGFIAGFLFNVVGLLIYGFLPDSYQRDLTRNIAQQLTEANQRLADIQRTQAEKSTPATDH